MITGRARGCDHRIMPASRRPRFWERREREKASRPSNIIGAFHVSRLGVGESLRPPRALSPQGCPLRSSSRSAQGPKFCRSSLKGAMDVTVALASPEMREHALYHIMRLVVSGAFGP
jgi:hypothetical protein